MTTPRHLRRSALLSLLLTSPAFAANGIWLNPVSGLWSDPTKWVGTIADGANNTASFNKLNLTADLTVHLDSARTIGNLLFADDVTPSNNWTLDNNANPLNTLTLDNIGTPVIQVDSNIATIALTLAGNKGLNKQGAGALVLTTAATYTGSTKLTEGTLRITGDNFLPAASDTNIGGTLDLRNANQTFSGPFAGAGAILTSGTSGTLTLSSPAATSTLTAALSGPLSLVKNNPGELTLNSLQSNTGPTLLNQGSLKLARDNGLSFNSPLTLATGTAFDLNGHDQTLLGTLSGTGTITNTFATPSNLFLLDTSSSLSVILAGNIGVQFAHSPTTLSGPATYTGVTSFTGIFKYGVNNALPAASPISAAGTLDLNGFNGTINPFLLANAANSSTTHATLTLSPGPASFNTVISGNLSVRFDSPTAIAYAPSAFPTYTGATTVNTPTLDLLTQLPATTALTINAGALLHIVFDSTVSSLQGAGTVTGAVLTVNNAAPNTSSVIIKSSFVKQGAALFTSLVSLDQVPTLTVAEGTFIAGTPNTFPNATAIRIFSTFDIHGFGTTLKNLSPDAAGIVTNTAPNFILVSIKTPLLNTVAVSFTGNLGLDISPAVTMSGHSTYLGNTFAGNGLTNGAHNALPITTSLAVSGTYDLAGFDQQLTAMTSGTVTNSSLTPSTFLLSATTFSSVGPLITGNITFAKSGGGSLPLGFANTYTGSTFINQGTLRCTVDAALPATTTVFLAPNTILNISNTLQSIRTLAGEGTVTGSGTLTLTGSPDMLLFTTFVGPLSLRASGVSNITLANTVNYTGSTTFNGALRFFAPSNAVGELLGSGNLYVDDNASLTSTRIDINAFTLRGTHTLRPDAGTSFLYALSLAGTTNNWTAHLELNNNPLAVQATSNKATALSTLQNQIAYGTSHPNGITSTTTAADPTHKTTLAIDNALLHLTTFYDHPVDTNSLLILSTWLGDSNLDRKVNVTDLGTLATYYGQPTPNGPLQGDFNNDGLVNVTDLGLLATNYGQGTTNQPFSLNSPQFQITNHQLLSTPEPTSLLILTLPLLLPRKRHP